MTKEGLLNMARELDLLRQSANLIAEFGTGPFDRGVAELLRAIADDVEADQDNWTLGRLSAIRLAKTFMGIDRTEEVPRGQW